MYFRTLVVLNLPPVVASFLMPESFFNEKGGKQKLYAEALNNKFGVNKGENLLPFLPNKNKLLPSPLNIHLDVSPYVFIQYNVRDVQGIR